MLQQWNWLLLRIRMHGLFVACFLVTCFVVLYLDGQKWYKTSHHQIRVSGCKIKRTKYSDTGALPNFYLCCICLLVCCVCLFLLLLHLPRTSKQCNWLLLRIRIRIQDLTQSKQTDVKFWYNFFFRLFHDMADLEWF